MYILLCMQVQGKITWKDFNVVFLQRDWKSCTKNFNWKFLIIVVKDINQCLFLKIILFD